MIGLFIKRGWFWELGDWRAISLSPWFARECLPQRCQPVERGSRQRAFLDRGERILELLWRCHTDQDGAHRRMRERKPRGSFGETRRKPLLDQRHQTARALPHSPPDRL